MRRPPVDHTLATRFLTYVNEAIELSERQLRADWTDSDAQYQLGASVGLLALYRGTVEGRTWAAFVERGVPSGRWSACENNGRIIGKLP